jgi:hypothetical protein
MIKQFTPILEVLIGTFNRPNRAINAVNSCLAIEDERLIVKCSSNGMEEKLLLMKNYYAQ